MLSTSDEVIFMPKNQIEIPIGVEDCQLTEFHREDEASLIKYLKVKAS
jgi:hypothetical protein